MFEGFLVILILVVVVGLPLTALVLAIVALVRARRLSERVARRIEKIEVAIQGLRGEPAPPRPLPEPAREPISGVEVVPEESSEPTLPATPVAAPAPDLEIRQAPIQWELVIGRKALGWVAVALLVFAAAFFLKYAYENNWIGPVGRVAIGCLVGCGLMVAGWRYHHRRWRIFSQMLSAAGVVVLYLSTYSAFGFYRLLPRDIAGIFLGVIVVESAVLAVRYNSLAIGLTAVLGGLLTPLLIQSAQDRYVELFTYLAVLNLGVVLLMLARSWHAIGTLGLVGAQALFWMWYDGNYHPEKLPWALGFQAAIFVLYLAHTVGVHVLRPRRANWEDLARMGLNATFWFLAVYTLLEEDYGDWMGTLAVGMAAVYAILARLMLALHPQDTRQLVTALAVSVGFVALAFPLQAEAGWIALGWAAEAAALWWFGQRIAARPLRAIAAVLAGCAVVHLLAVDIPRTPREPFVPILNEFALPALGVVVCILAAVVATRKLVMRRDRAEQMLVGMAALAAVLLLWLVLSVDCYGYFDAWSRVSEVDRAHWRWLGQMSLSVLWAVFATAVLTVGFLARQAGLRWLAMGLYAVTVVKVFIVDMERLDEIYRIAAFFVAAIFVGAAAWAYQRIKLDRAPVERVEGADHE
jgi:uncharacterized membrane protein